jgi:hypothetical protein
VRGDVVPSFWPRPPLLRVAKIALANRTKKGESMRCGVMRGGGDAGWECGFSGAGLVWAKKINQGDISHCKKS